MIKSLQSQLDVTNRNAEKSHRDGLLKYRKDGSYTIDNMSVECAIRPLTVCRKNSLFFSSEEGVETALTFLTLIETCKNAGLDVRDYIATTMKQLLSENKDYDSLIPMAVTV